MNFIMQVAQCVLLVSFAIIVAVLAGVFLTFALGVIIDLVDLWS